MKDADQRTDWHAQETYKGLVQVSLSSLRFGVFANGGAAIALLAFLGKEGQAAITVASLKTSLALFLGGVALGGLAHISAYVTQLRLYGESALGEPQRGIFRHNTFLWITLALGVLCVAAFVLGSWCGLEAIQAAAP